MIIDGTDGYIVINCDYCNKMKTYNAKLNIDDIIKRDKWIYKKGICFCCKECYNICKNIRRKQ